VSIPPLIAFAKEGNRGLALRREAPPVFMGRFLYGRPSFGLLSPRFFSGEGPFFWPIGAKEPVCSFYPFGESLAAFSVGPPFTGFFPFLSWWPRLGEVSVAPRFGFLAPGTEPVLVGDPGRGDQDMGSFLVPSRPPSSAGRSFSGRIEGGGFFFFFW